MTGDVDDVLEDRSPCPVELDELVIRTGKDAVRRGEHEITRERDACAGGAP